MKKNNLILLFSVGLFFRLVGQSVSPPGFHQDEAAFGYNAYSIYKTGKDEFGNPFPLILESVGDYKSALYSYLIIPFMVLLGPTELAVRLPAILFGTFSIILLYKLARAININHRLSIIAGLFTALSPWHILQSRFAAETTVAAFFILAMVLYLVFWYQKPKIKYLLVAAFCAALSIYAYASARITAPLLLLAFAFIAWNSMRSYWKQVLISMALGAIILSPLLAIFINNFDALARRPSSISVFNQAGIRSQLWEETTQDPSDQNPIVTRFFHNKIRTYGREILRRYFQHFNIGYLMISGDPFDRFKTPYSGVLLWIVFPLALIGGYLIMTRKKSQSTHHFILAWLFLSPVVSSMSVFTPNSLHTLDQVYPFALIAAIGLRYLISTWNPRRYFAGYIIVGVLCVINFSLFLYGYFAVIPNNLKYSRNWGYGLREISKKVSDLSPNYQKFVFFGGLIFDNLAFNLVIDPVLFQSEVQKISSPDPSFFDHVQRFGKFEFRKSLFSDEELVPGVAYVGLDQSIAMNNQLRELAVVVSPDGKQFHRIVELQ